MSTRTGKQTALLVLGIVKILGAAIYCIGGIALLLNELLPPAFVSKLTASVASGNGSPYYSDLPNVLRIGGIVALFIGALGVVHGIMDIIGARPGYTATTAGVFGILGCLFDVYVVLSTGLVGLFMLALNVTRAIISFMVTSEANAPTGVYLGHGQPGVPMQGQSNQYPQGQYPGYPQQQGMPPQSAPYPGYPQPGMPAQQDAYPGYPQQQTPPQQNNYPTL